MGNGTVYRFDYNSPLYLELSSFDTLYSLTSLSRTIYSHPQWERNYAAKKNMDKTGSNLLANSIWTNAQQHSNLYYIKNYLSQLKTELCI